MANENIANEKLEALRKREAALKAAIARELVRQQKRKEKEDARVCSIIGAALVQNAAKHEDFELMLKGVLKTSTWLSESDRRLLRTRNWF